ncbi:cupredoxin domain-containing protein [Halobiforma nitratireducens]|uniref:Halocyanin-like protein (Copper-containing protein) 2 n=1 Tax=Halobiforma nitratireducens JCM 10879 TaxID=1227454 RepID=M0M7G9_9EURY|nr:hypothetical protein [Halobiforma nitratireducens]EMA40534.1 halocyanin-like protein (copper-containing protein) 2 [Halobiforma nitratireducens JCM 10879]
MGERRVSRRRLLATVGASTGIGTAGCLEGEVGADDPQLGDPEPFERIELASEDGDVSVDPPVVHLVDGGTVEWTVDAGVHDVTAYHPDTHGSRQRIPADAEPWASGRLEGGDGFDRVFDGEGVYDYVSTPNDALGAAGSVVVGWPDPNGEPGLEPPGDECPPITCDVLERYNERVRDVLEEVHG